MPRDEAARRSTPPIRKSLGQHFLSDPRILTRIADSLGSIERDTVIEIGPGRGSLSTILADRAARLVLVEYDRALAAKLRTQFAARANVVVIEADVLDVDLAATADGPFKLIGNVPYYITTPILFHALQWPRPEVAVYLIQREVAERIVAAPGGSEYGALSVNVQAFANPEILFRVSAGSFFPPPKVESAAIRLRPRHDALVDREHEEVFRRLVVATFGMRRKQLRRVLRELFALDQPEADGILDAAEIAPDLRPEALAPADFARLCAELTARSLSLGS